jgi:conjugative relaxase-like TrwC/TraI family protein
MLGIGKLTAGAEDYYLGIAAGIEDYYVGIASPGQWIGSSQQLLGLTGEIQPEVLRAVFAGVDPTTGLALLNSANRTVMAFDLTFKADKSVSLLHAFASPEVAAAVEAAHGAGVASSIRYLEETAVHTRRGHNGVETIHGTGLVAASFRHYRNRNDDPHLHDHVLVPNMVKGDDGRWSTLDARHLYAHAKTAGYVYQAVLRDQLTRTLGVEFGPVTNGVASIEGIPRRAIDAFSTRRAEILEHLDAVGASSAKAAQIATLQTRRAKEQQPDLGAIQAEWRLRAVANGLDTERLADVLGRVRADGLSEQQRTAAAARMLGPDGLTGHMSTFDQRDLLRAWCEAHPQGATLSEVQFLSAQMIANEPSLVGLAGERWTTQELLACEQSVLDAATRGIGRGIATVPSSAIDAAIASRPTITAEQEHVARALVGGGDGVSVLIAPAGTGKGFTLGVAQAAWGAAGVEVSGRRSLLVRRRNFGPVRVSGP